MTLLDPTRHAPRADEVPARPPHTPTRPDRPVHTTPADVPEKEVPEMTLTALLDAGAVGAAAGDEVPCRQEDPELWFAEAPDDVEFAKTLCGTCPVQEACLAGARQRREPWGVWGGQLFVGGVVVPRKRPRGRPRKDAVPSEAPDLVEARAS